MLSFTITGRWQHVINRALFWGSRLLFLAFMIEVAESLSPDHRGDGTLWVLFIMLLYGLEHITRH